MGAKLESFSGLMGGRLNKNCEPLNSWTADLEMSA